MPEQIVLTGRNLWIVDKKPQTFENISYENGVLSIGKEQIQLSKDVYAALFCEELRNITLIVQQGEIHQMTMVLESKESFDRTFDFVKGLCPELEFSEQGRKINGYAASLVEKLREGVTVTIIDTKDNVKEIFCPDCGMQCDPNIPYCLECGASV